MALKVPQHIRQRLAAVIDDLKNAIEQEAAKAYLTNVTTFESLEICDDSWMDFIID